MEGGEGKGREGKRGDGDGLTQQCRETGGKSIRFPLVGGLL
jgi:hypothetical protein